MASARQQPGSQTVDVPLQGVLSPSDAVIAVQQGVDGIIVSNHGKGKDLVTDPLSSVCQLSVPCYSSSCSHTVTARVLCRVLQLLHQAAWLC